MIVKSYIEKNLKAINRLFLSSSSVQQNLFYSKLAILELCGWTEVSMDDVAKRTAKRFCQKAQSHKYIEEIITWNFGFQYEKHFRKMLIPIIGLRGIEHMENKINQSHFQRMCGALSTLKPYRDVQAHEYIKGTTLRIIAPSVAISSFYLIYTGLTDIDRVLKSMKIMCSAKR
ncbi:MAG: hypothetical protein MUO58_14505 [Anaerolineales bacterium]|nr:hypothetical protein [Anaerolineales bacterium]